MKMITAAELQQHLDRYLTQAQQEEIVVTLTDGALVRLSGIELEDVADQAIEDDPRFAQLIEARREHYRQRGGVPLADVKQALIDELTDDLSHADPHTRLEAANLLAALGRSAVAPSNDEGMPEI
jgi:hypothetical protein